MKKSLWMAVLLFLVFVGSLVAVFGLTTDAELEASLLTTFDALVSFLVGAGTGVAGGAAVGFMKGIRTKQGAASAPPSLSPPLVAATCIVLVAMVFMFAWTDEPELQRRIVGYSTAILPFVLGAGLGSIVGGRAGFDRGSA